MNVSRLLLAVTFIFSGLVKIVDPRGTQYKFEDYFQAFGWTHWIPDFLPLWSAVILSVFEFCIGIYMFFGIRRHTTCWLYLLFLCVMTPLTLYLALADPISDCGCFGDAVTLTNWETFGKNVFLLVMTVIVLRYRRLMTRFISERNQWMISFYSIIFGFVLAGFCIYYLPVFDFRPYHIGADIPQEMQIPKGAEEPEFVTTFVFEKDGVEKEFTVDDYPKDTASWHFVNSKTVQVKKGYVPPIHDFSITTWPDGNDITEQVLADRGYTFLLVAPYLEYAEDSNIDRINELYDYCQEHGYAFYCLTSSSDEAIARWQDLTGADYPFGLTDGVTLKTMVRSNPGLILLKGGIVYNKWSCNELPKEEQLNAPLANSDLGRLQVASRTMTTSRVILWFLVPLFLLASADRIWVGSKMYKRMKHKNRIINLLKTKNMRKNIVAGNWKMNLNLQEGVALATELNAALAADKPNCDVIICTPFIHLASVANVLDAKTIGLGAENCADKEKGAYTGEVSAAMVKSTGAQYVILGHSERRAYYHETAEILKEKVNLALANGLKVIFCVGEVLEDREANRQNEIVKAQLAGSLFDLTAEQFSNIILAYEPVWAIGTGKTATAEQAEEMHAFIRLTIAEKFGKDAAENVSILYGGSCKPSNAKEIFAKPDVDGGLIGGAALKCADFKGIIDAWKA
ncbi:MAG: triose-phosphate isomerase [Paraprevotella sp.]|nr:triose-phosphate isomerase [Paraprevotella sp.]